jgi:hypothetical protein
MLKSDHPQSEHIFAAARLEDSVLTMAKSIVSSPAAKRHLLVTQSDQTLAKMRSLNLEHFSGSRFISETIDDLQKAVHRLAEIDQPSLDIIMPVLTRLGSAEGFGTDSI